MMICSGDVRGRSAGDGQLASADLRTPFAPASFNRFQLVLTGLSGPFANSQVTSPEGLWLSIRARTKMNLLLPRVQRHTTQGDVEVGYAMMIISTTP